MSVPEGSVGKGKKKLVLIVDDQIRVVKMTADILEEAGFDTTGATSGRQALELLVNKQPDIMLLDIVMPDMNGLEVLSQLRAFSQIPVIATSFDLSVRSRSFSSGADTFLAKPFKPEDLVRKIEGLLNREP